MAIYTTARFQVRPEGLQASLQAIREFITYIKANEPGTLQYTSVQRSDDPASFLHFFAFTDETAHQQHQTSEGVQQFTSVLYPLLASDGVEFASYHVVAST